MTAVPSTGSCANSGAAGISRRPVVSFMACEAPGAGYPRGAQHLRPGGGAVREKRLQLAAQPLFAAGRLPMVMSSVLQISARVCRGGRGGAVFHAADVRDENRNPFRQPPG